MPVPTTEFGTSGQSIQVITRAASIMRALRDSETGLSLGQIAKRVDLPRSTVQRIVNALIEERFVIADKSAGGYCLGPALLSFARADRRSMAETLRPFLSALSEHTGETVDLTQFRNNQLVFIDQIVGSQRLRAVATVGEVFPMTTTANGKATLAQLDNDTLAAILHAELGQGRAVTEHRRNLEKELAAIQQQGFALDLNEHTDGISAVGASLVDTTGQLFAISIPVPSHRFETNKVQLIDSLLTTVDEIRRSLD